VVCRLVRGISISGRITCYYELFDRSASSYENIVRSSIMSAWKLSEETDDMMVFKEGSISNLKVCIDFSINRAISRFMFSGVRELSSVARLLKSIMRNASSCNLLMSITGLTSNEILEIEGRVKKFKLRGLIEDPSTHSFRCDIMLKQFSYSIAVYGEDCSADVIARFKDEREVDETFSSVKSIIRPSVIDRLFKGLK